MPDRFRIRLTARGAAVQCFGCGALGLLFPPDPSCVANVVEHIQAMQAEANSSQIRVD